MSKYAIFFTLCWQIFTIHPMDLVHYNPLAISCEQDYKCLRVAHYLHHYPQGERHDEAECCDDEKKAIELFFNDESKRRDSDSIQCFQTAIKEKNYSYIASLPLAVRQNIFIQLRNSIKASGSDRSIYDWAYLFISDTIENCKETLDKDYGIGVCYSCQGPVGDCGPSGPKGALLIRDEKAWRVARYLRLTRNKIDDAERAKRKAFLANKRNRFVRHVKEYMPFVKDAAHTAVKIIQSIPDMTYGEIRDLFEDLSGTTSAVAWEVAFLSRKNMFSFVFFNATEPFLFGVYLSHFIKNGTSRTFGDLLDGPLFNQNNKEL